MGEIKPGDLVMVVKPTPCCGNDKACGEIFIAGPYRLNGAICKKCHTIFWPDDEPCVRFVHGTVMLISRLKKIDPPPVGDTLPTREELHA